MEELTHQNLPTFWAQLADLFWEQTFTIKTARGHVHSGVRLSEFPQIIALPSGLWQIQLEMGNLVQPFTVYYPDSASDPVYIDEGLSRLRFNFTNDSLMVKIWFLSPTLRGSEDIVRLWL